MISKIVNWIHVVKTYLDVIEILLMSLLIDPRVLDHNWLGFESRLLLLREKSRHTSLLGFGAEFVLGSSHQLSGRSHSLPWVRGLPNRELLHRLPMITKKKLSRSCLEIQICLTI